MHALCGPLTGSRNAAFDRVDLDRPVGGAGPHFRLRDVASFLGFGPALPVLGKRGGGRRLLRAPRHGQLAAVVVVKERAPVVGRRATSFGRPAAATRAGRFPTRDGIQARIDTPGRIGTRSRRRGGLLVRATLSRYPSRSRRQPSPPVRMGKRGPSPRGRSRPSRWFPCVPLFRRQPCLSLPASVDEVSGAAARGRHAH